MNEADAFQAEMLLISLHGRVDLSTGCLRNLTDGGEENTRRVFTEESRRKISAVHRGKVVSADTVRKRQESAKKTIAARGSKRYHLRAADSYHCCRGHELTPENTYVRPNGHRVCRECTRARLNGRLDNPDVRVRSMPELIGRVLY